MMALLRFLLGCAAGALSVAALSRGVVFVLGYPTLGPDGLMTGSILAMFGGLLCGLMTVGVK
jgi:hypothetical protein